MFFVVFTVWSRFFPVLLASSSSSLPSVFLFSFLDQRNFKSSAHFAKSNWHLITICSKKVAVNFNDFQTLLFGFSEIVLLLSRFFYIFFIWMCAVNYIRSCQLSGNNFNLSTLLNSKNAMQNRPTVTNTWKVVVSAQNHTIFEYIMGNLFDKPENCFRYKLYFTERYTIIIFIFGTWMVPQQYCKHHCCKK